MPTETTTGTHELDVRNVDGDPFGKIMDALDSLESGEQLVLINSFEPEPLYEVLQARGYTHETTQVDDAEFHVRIEQA